ncbi:thiamine phosphate synthase [Virgibacillus ainsalahensis]
MGSQNCDRNPVDILEQAAQSGITAFQFREKGEGSFTGDAKLELGKQLRNICRQYNIPFIVNDDIDLVEALDADGVHVGQDDSSVKLVRECFGDKIIGLSVSTQDEVAASPLSLVDYVGAGPIFSTSSKADAKAVVGLEWIQTVRSQFPNLPIVGIGGINTENAPSVIKAGADGVSVISAITQASDVIEAVKQL